MLWTPKAPAVIRPPELWTPGMGDPFSDEAYERWAMPNPQRRRRQDGSAVVVASGIQFVGGFSNDSTNSIFTFDYATLSGGISDTPAEWDFAVLLHGGASDANRSMSFGTWTTKGTSNHGELYADDTEDANAELYSAFHDADTAASANNGASFGHGNGCVVLLFRGVDQTTPLDGVAVQTATGTNSVLVDPPSITPVTSGAWIVTAGVGAHTDGTQTYSASDMTYMETNGRGTTHDLTIGMAYYDGWTSGAFDPAAWSFSGTDGASFSWAAYSLVLRPA